MLHSNVHSTMQKDTHSLSYPVISVAARTLFFARSMIRSPRLEVVIRGAVHTESVAGWDKPWWHAVS